MKTNSVHYSFSFDALSMEFMKIRFTDKKKIVTMIFFFLIKGGSMPIENGSYMKLT